MAGGGRLMPADIKIEYDDREMVEGLNRLAQAGRDLKPVMGEIAAALEAGAQQSFRDEQSPDGKDWDKPSEETTQPRRAARRTWPGMILQEEGRLVGSLTSRYDGRSAEAGTNLVYAATHQFGAEQGEFGTTARGGPIPWGRHSSGGPRLAVPLTSMRRLPMRSVVTSPTRSSRHGREKGGA